MVSLHALQDYLYSNFNILPKNVDLYSSFAHDLGLDAFEVATLVVDMELIFDLLIPTFEAERMATVGDLVHFSAWQVHSSSIS